MISKLGWLLYSRTLISFRALRGYESKPQCCNERERVDRDVWDFVVRCHPVHLSRSSQVDLEYFSVRGVASHRYSAHHFAAASAAAAAPACVRSVELHCCSPRASSRSCGFFRKGDGGGGSRFGDGCLVRFLDMKVVLPIVPINRPIEVVPNLQSK